MVEEGDADDISQANVEWTRRGRRIVRPSHLRDFILGDHDWALFAWYLSFFVANLMEFIPMIGAIYVSMFTSTHCIVLQLEEQANTICQDNYEPLSVPLWVPSRTTACWSWRGHPNYY